MFSKIILLAIYCCSFANLGMATETDQSKQALCDELHTRIDEQDKDLKDEQAKIDALKSIIFHAKIYKDGVILIDAGMVLAAIAGYKPYLNATLGRPGISGIADYILDNTLKVVVGAGLGGTGYYLSAEHLSAAQAKLNDLDKTLETEKSRLDRTKAVGIKNCQFSVPSN